MHLQLGTPGGVEHRHLDGGSFQVWRKGRWLTRESTGYSAQIAPFGGGSGSIDSSDAPAHNGLLFEGRSTGIWIGNQGPVPIPPQGPASEQPRGLPKVQRLQHEALFAYVATDYSDAYRNELDTRVDWPYADKAWREFLFIRPLHALSTGSPAINAGRNSQGFANDQRGTGFPRVIDDAADIGSFEMRTDVIFSDGFQGISHR